MRTLPPSLPLPASKDASTAITAMAFGVVNSDCSEECARIEVTLHGPSCRNPLLHTLLFCTLSSSQNTQRYGSQRPADRNFTRGIRGWSRAHESCAPGRSIERCHAAARPRAPLFGTALCSAFWLSGRDKDLGTYGNGRSEIRPPADHETSPCRNASYPSHPSHPTGPLRRTRD